MAYTTRALPLLLLFTSCATTAPVVVGSGPLEESVELRFGWEPGSRATVEVMRSTLDASPRGRFLDETRMRYRLESEEAESGIRLVQKDLTVEILPSRWIPRTVEMVVLEVAQPSFTVNGWGNFLGVDDPAAAQIRVAHWMGKHLAEVENPRMRTRLLDLFSEEAMAERTSGMWRDLVGIWSGGTMEVGRSYHARDTISVEGLGGIPVEMVVEVTLLGRVPCGDGEEEGACVHLVLTASPAPEQRPLLMKFTSALFPSDPEKEVEIEHGMELITEPRGLRPRWMRARRSVRIPLLAGEEVVIAEERQLAFSWSEAR